MSWHFKIFISVEETLLTGLLILAKLAADNQNSSFVCSASHIYGMMRWRSNTPSPCRKCPF
jgi:hypothetical protein